MEGEREVNIILLGESDVGKTSLLLRFIEEKFKGTPSRTIINKYEKVIEVEGSLVKLILWDTAGREAYYNMVKSYYKVADGVLLVYDVQDADSFSALSKWFIDFKSANENAEVLIAGNKTEDENKRFVTTVDMEHFLGNEKIDCIEVSAKLNKNVTLLFHRLVLKILTGKGTLLNSKDSQLIELIKSDTPLSSSLVLCSNIDTCSSMNTSRITESAINCIESTDHRNSTEIFPPSATESLVTTAESTEHCILNTSNIRSSAQSLATSMESTGHRNPTSLDATNTTESLDTQVDSAEHRISSTIVPSIAIGVESIEQHLSTVRYEPNSIALLPNEIYELEDDEDSPSNNYGLLIYSPENPDRISESDSHLFDSAEIAEEYFEATKVKENMPLSHLQDDMRRISDNNSKFIDSAEIAEEYF